MTRDEILKMPANKNTDIFVARNVLGHVVRQDSNSEWWEGLTTIAQYSELIEYAVNVAMHLCSTKYAFFTLSVKDEQCMAEFEIDTVRYFAFADTIPLAICRAASLTTMSKS